MTLDFAALADGVRRNNVGVAGISVAAEVRFKQGRVVVPATGQRFPLSGTAPADGWTWFEVVDWDDPDRTALAPRAVPETR
jgi:hypothetical protein